MTSTLIAAYWIGSLVFLALISIIVLLSKVEKQAVTKRVDKEACSAERINDLMKLQRERSEKVLLERSARRENAKRASLKNTNNTIYEDIQSTNSGYRGIYGTSSTSGNATDAGVSSSYSSSYGSSCDSGSSSSSSSSSSFGGGDC